MSAVPSWMGLVLLWEIPESSLTPFYHGRTQWEDSCLRTRELELSRHWINLTLSPCHWGLVDLGQTPARTPRSRESLELSILILLHIWWRQWILRKVVNAAREMFPVPEVLSADFANAAKQAVLPDPWPWNDFIQPIIVIFHPQVYSHSQQYRLGPCPPRLQVCTERLRMYAINQWKIRNKVLSEQYR